MTLIAEGPAMAATVPAASSSFLPRASLRATRSVMMRTILS